jgi:hypothetical protein
LRFPDDGPVTTPRQPRSDREAAANMPHLSGLLRTSQIDRILNLTHGRGGYPDTTAFQVSVCTRLLDKALREWDQAREALIEHAEGKRQFGGLFDGISHFENFVVSLDRLVRYTSVLQDKPEMAAFASMKLPDSVERQRLRDFRNRVIHGDEDLAGGKGGRGLPTATLEPRAQDIALHGRQLGTLETLSFAEMALWVEQSYAFVRAVIAHIS